MSKLVLSIPAETQAGEQRVALIPSQVESLVSLFKEIRIGRDAGVAAQHANESYERAGAKVIDNAADLYAGTDITLCVKRGNPEKEAEALSLWQPGMALVGFLDPQVPDRSHLPKYAAAGITGFSFELMPQTVHTTPMHATAAMSTVTGEVVINEAAERLGGLEGKKSFSHRGG